MGSTEGGDEIWIEGSDDGLCERCERRAVTELERLDPVLARVEQYAQWTWYQGGNESWKEEIQLERMP